jgi:hypothetical protein
LPEISITRSDVGRSLPVAGNEKATIVPLTCLAAKKECCDVDSTRGVEACVADKLGRGLVFPASVPLVTSLYFPQYILFTTTLEF